MRDFKATDDFGDSLYLVPQSRRVDVWTDRGDSVGLKLEQVRDLHYWLGQAIEEMERDQ